MQTRATKRRFCARPRHYLLTAIFLVVGTAHAADLKNGKEIYQLHCEVCHGIGGQSSEPGTPDFSRGDGLYVPDSIIVQKIRSGVGTMPAYRGLLDDSDIRDVIAYLRSLQ